MLPYFLMFPSNRKTSLLKNVAPISHKQYV